MFAAIPVFLFHRLVDETMPVCVRSSNHILMNAERNRSREIKVKPFNLIVFSKSQHLLIFSMIYGLSRVVS